MIYVMEFDAEPHTQHTGKAVVIALGEDEAWNLVEASLKRNDLHLVERLSCAAVKPDDLGVLHFYSGECC